jgi:hypothetical protein
VVLSARVGERGRVPADRKRGAEQPRRFLGTRIRKLTLLLLPAFVSQRNVVDSSDSGDPGGAGGPAPILNSVRGGRAMTERHGEQWSGSGRGTVTRPTRLNSLLSSRAVLPSPAATPAPASRQRVRKGEDGHLVVWVRVVGACIAGSDRGRVDTGSYVES